MRASAWHMRWELRAPARAFPKQTLARTRSHMLQRLSKAAAALAITGSLVASPLLAQPAEASTGSTYTIIESALALIGGIILYNNYQHKKQAANRVVGYTRNGGTVY